MSTIRRRFWSRFFLLTFIIFGIVGAVGAFYIHTLFQELTPRIEHGLSNMLGVRVRIGGASLNLQHGLGVAIYDIKIGDSERCTNLIRIKKISLAADIWELLQRKIIVDELVVDGVNVKLKLENKGGIKLSAEASKDCLPDLLATPVSAPNFNTEPIVGSTPSNSSFDPSSPDNLFSANNFQIKVIRINDFDAKVNLLNGMVALDDLQGTSLLSFNANNIDLNNLHLNGSLQDKKLEITGKRLIVDRSFKSFDYSDLYINFAGFKANASGAFEFVEGTDNTAAPPVFSKVSGGAEISEVSGNLQELNSLFSSLDLKKGAMDLRGQIKGSLKINFADLNTIQGAIILNNFSYGENIRISKGFFNDLHLDVLGGNVKKISSIIAVEDLFIRDRKDEYIAKLIKGDALYTTEPQWRFSSNKLVVGGFGFNDRQTLLHEVNADLNAVVVRSDTKGDVTSEVILNGRKLKLLTKDQKSNDPTFEIKEVVSVDAPLRIKVLSQGGYEIGGTLHLGGATMVWDKKELQNVNGSVKMYISKPLKTFQMMPVRCVINKESAILNGDFEMTPELYKLNTTFLSAFGGNANMEFSLSRDPQRGFRSSLRAFDIDLKRAESGLFPNDKASLSGILKEGDLSLNTKLSEFKKNITGNGRGRILQGDLKEFDFTHVLGKALNAIPGSALGRNKKGDKDDVEPPAQSAKVEFQIQPGGIANINIMELQRESYLVTGKGVATFDGELKISARVTFLKENLGKIGSGFQAITGLFGDIGRLDVPIKIAGKVPNLSINVDMETFLKEKSGLSTAHSVIKSTGGIASDVVDALGKVVASPFSRSKKKEKRDN